jgi:AraC-like DNA-binding protein
MLRFISYMAPLSASLLFIAMLLVVRWRYKHMTAVEKRLLWILIAYLIEVGLNCIFGAFYAFAPKIYSYVSPIALLSLLLVPPTLYHIIFIISETGNKKAVFNKVHYIIPVAISIGFVVWRIFLPDDIRVSLSIPLSDTHGYDLYAWFLSIRWELRGVLCVIYLILSIHRLRRYQKAIVDYSADTKKTAMKWMWVMIGIFFAITPLPFFSFFISNPAILKSFAPLVSMIIVVVQQSLLYYYLVDRRYVVMSSDGKRPVKDNEVHLNRRSFDMWIEEHKPYLNHDLRITDLMTELGTNRTYLSQFINKEYGMNFSYYINSLRLQEYERMRNNPANRNTSDRDLLFSVGFNTYGGYKSFIKKRDELLAKTAPRTEK